MPWRRTGACAAEGRLFCRAQQHNGCACWADERAYLPPCMRWLEGRAEVCGRPRTRGGVRGWDDGDDGVGGGGGLAGMRQRSGYLRKVDAALIPTSKQTGRLQQLIRTYHYWSSHRRSTFAQMSLAHNCESERISRTAALRDMRSQRDQQNLADEKSQHELFYLDDHVHFVCNRESKDHIRAEDQERLKSFQLHSISTGCALYGSN